MQIVFVLATCWLALFLVCRSAQLLSDGKLHSGGMYRGFYHDTFLYALLIVLPAMMFTTRRLLSRVLRLKDQYIDMLQLRTNEAKASTLQAFNHAIDFI